MEQQYRWHTTVDFCWEQQKEMNFPKAKFVKKHAYFQLNLDEESVMGLEGSIKVIASIFGKKVQKNMDDFKGFVSIIQIGSAAGVDGSIFFLCAAKDKKNVTDNLTGDLSRHKKYNLPKGSKVICTPTAYLTAMIHIDALKNLHLLNNSSASNSQQQENERDKSTGVPFSMMNNESSCF